LPPSLRAERGYKVKTLRRGMAEKKGYGCGVAWQCDASVT